MHEDFGVKRTGKRRAFPLVFFSIEVLYAEKESIKPMEPQT
jgi:hypothetical protein